MIEELTAEIRHADLLKLLRPRHRRMSALSNQHIKRRNTTTGKKLRCDRKKEIRVVVACLVGNDREYTLTGIDAVERFPDFVRESCWT